MGSVHADRAAELEVEWWRLHRAHQYGHADVGALTDALDALYSFVYGVPAGTMRLAARLRAEAMDLSDEWVQAGCSLEDRRLAAERRALVASYTALREGVERDLVRDPDGRSDPSGDPATARASPPRLTP